MSAREKKIGREKKEKEENGVLSKADLYRGIIGNDLFYATNAILYSMLKSSTKGIGNTVSSVPRLVTRGKSSFYSKKNLVRLIRFFASIDGASSKHNYTNRKGKERECKYFLRKFKELESFYIVVDIIKDKTTFSALIKFGECKGNRAAYRVNFLCAYASSMSRVTTAIDVRTITDEKKLEDICRSISLEESRLRMIQYQVKPQIERMDFAKAEEAITKLLKELQIKYTWIDIDPKKDVIVPKNTDPDVIKEINQKAIKIMDEMKKNYIMESKMMIINSYLSKKSKLVLTDLKNSPRLSNLILGLRKDSDNIDDIIDISRTVVEKRKQKKASNKDKKGGRM